MEGNLSDKNLRRLDNKENYYRTSNALLCINYEWNLKRRRKGGMSSENLNVNKQIDKGKKIFFFSFPLIKLLFKR